MKLSDLLKIFISIINNFIIIVGRFVFKNIIYGEKGATVPPIKNQLLLEPATVLAEKIRTRKVTSVEVLKAFIDRIKEVNPVINCVIDEGYKEALKEAEHADEFIASEKMTVEEMAKSKPFLGVPISTKDAVAVKGLINSSGWFYRKDYRAEKDSEAIKKMREAGAIPFCITNVPELCLWIESSNVIYGRSKNPYDNFRICGGSSGGEGALLSSGGSPFGIGSDIAGSIRIPSFFNGIFGLKPSRSVVSNEGHFPSPEVPEWEHMMAIGPMSRFAVDLLPMMKILVKDEKLELLKLDKPVNVKKLKVYYQENDQGGDLVMPVEKDIQNALLKVVDYFKNTLKVEVQKVEIKRTKDALGMFFVNMTAKGSTPLAQAFSPNPNKKINPIWEMIKMIFGKSNHTLISLLTSFKQEHSMKAGSPKHTHYLEEHVKLMDEFREMLKDDMSVFLYPTHPTVAPYHNETLIRFNNLVYTCLINLLGMPSCNIPLGLGSEGLPLGIQCVANYNNDRLCLAVACELEKAFGGWIPPS